MIHAVILAGGSGTRLWPLSRRQLPKQFLRIEGERSLLEATLDRLQPVVDPANALIVTGTEHARGEAYQALHAFKTLLEPVGRNTAPAIALAAAWLSRGGDDPMLVVLPADHVIRDRPAFHDALRRAVEAAEEGALVTFGIRPTAPETGYGYIQAVTDGTAVAPVQRFTEKPDLATAEGFLAEGNYWWNSGMFVWRASSILAEVERHLPEVHEVLQRIRRDWDASATADPQPAVEAHFAQMPSISIDYGVLERSDRVRLVPCDIGWSDVGSWDAVHDLAEQDDRGNALQGNALAIDCDNTLLHGNGRLVAAVGVRDLCVVETADAILIAPRGQTQRVREVVDELTRRDASECRLHRTVQRPWGSYTVLEESPGYKMKRIAVSPGASLSLQRHQHRSEHWIVVAGTATVTRGDDVFTVAPNESTYIPIGQRHRLENRGKIPLQIIEVQVGEYLEEDDIERFEDVYDR
ncbi:mannose-1-phosphate guanylyltransferase/mannose-6-phosphate isomerase, partial [Thioalkalivibrio sp.]|uniref:mannose-1-phosphate guanylyltransferase/mannose-6-phosphate isomerase n=1 Tax=Thioalkalivibrio sp. TaxID=2093813 RepID=UPI0012D51111